VLVRIQVSDFAPGDEKEFEEALAKLNRRRPEWVAQMTELSRNETRRHLRASGLTAAKFPSREAHAMTMPAEVTGVLDRYATKLGKALYYLHTSRIVPTLGIVKTRALTNTEFMSPNFPLRDFDILNVALPLSRAYRDLSDQFAYRYAVPLEGGAAGFIVQFRESVAMLILVFEDSEKYEARKEARQGAAREPGTT